jgi:GNAT superfamily N-acetyltransferase
MSRSKWRLAQSADDSAIAEMCRHLYLEDPGPSPIPPENIHTTLVTLRQSPDRGRAVVLEVQGRVSGYALLIAFWSNELGGDVCEVDELFVLPQHRNQGYGSALFAAVVGGELWPGPITALALGTTRGNARARRLYERLGFAEIGVTMICRIQQRG